jgi:hypothetical protein
MINPPVVTPPDAGYLFDEDPVFGVSFNGEHRAYPLRILNAHEMANDGVGACLSRWPPPIEPSAVPESCITQRSMARSSNLARRACSTALIS